jgi:outer membrane protein assembly factor BamE
MTSLRVAALIVLLCAGCKEVPTVPMPTLTPHRIDIQQGNVVTQDMVDKLKPGMTPSQVRFILGTPLVVDTFHKDRWDYVYRYEKGGKLVEHRRIIVIFEDDKLVRIEGDVVAAKPRAEGAGPRTDGAAAPAGKPASAQPQPSAQPEPQPAQGANLTTQGGEPASAPAPKPEAAAAVPAEQAKQKEEKSKEEKAKEERGFFGRMLERLGF